jgi:hypothetical protein
MAKICMCMILLLLRLASNILMNIILIMAKKRLNLTNLRTEMYHVEGPMPKTPVAPDPLMVGCLKSWTTVGAGRYTPCHPSVHREVDEADPRKKGHHQEGDEDVPMKKKTVSSRGDAPKNLIAHTHPSRCPDVNADSRGLLSQLSMHIEN